MTEPRFLQIHSLSSYAAALLNRDDAGFAKRLPTAARCARESPRNASSGTGGWRGTRIRWTRSRAHCPPGARAGW